MFQPMKSPSSVATVVTSDYIFYNVSRILTFVKTLSVNSVLLYVLIQKNSVKELCWATRVCGMVFFHFPGKNFSIK